MTEVYVMYRENKLVAVYSWSGPAQIDKERLEEMGYTDVRIQVVPVWTTNTIPTKEEARARREAEEDEAMKRMQERI